MARDILRSKSVEVNLEMVDPISGETRIRKVKYTSDKNIAYSIASVMILKALSGDNFATQIILDRTEGKAPENLSPPQNEDEEKIEYDVRERLYDEDNDNIVDNR